MVHGASHDQRYFSSQVQAFQQDYRLLLIDLPGHGQSASSPGPYGFEEYAMSVLAAMDAAGVDETHYLASHTGAAVALPVLMSASAASLSRPQERQSMSTVSLCAKMG